MRKRPNRHIGRKGFTLVEVIVVLALLAIIAAFATPGIVTYLRNMQQVRQDETVRLLYSAAQNRLTYLSGHDPDGAYTDFRSLFREGTVNVEVPDGTETVTGKGTSTDTDDIKLAIMMKFGENGALTDTPVIMDEGQVASYHFTDTDEAGKNAMAAILGDSGLLNVIDPGEVTVDLDASLRFVLRVSYLHGVLEAPSIYNEANVQIPDSANVMTDQLKMSVNAENGEELIVHVTCSSLAENYKSQLKEENLKNFHLVMTLTSDSGKSETYDLSNESWFAPSLTNGVYSADVTLDSLTSGKHFAELFEPAGFVPGEDITATFQLFYDGNLESGTGSDKKPVIMNPSALSSVTVNSLFADVKDVDGKKTAYLANGRHLQNLTDANCKDKSVTAAVQYGDIDWKNTQGYKNYADDLKFAPIDNENIGSFSGKNGATQHTIFDLQIAGQDNKDAGLFCDTAADISDVWLENPTVSGTKNAGVLAGYMTGGSITNCRVYVTDTGKLSNYEVTTSGGNAGGLVGVISGKAAIENSFAALNKVSGDIVSGYAGGLIGSVSGKTVIKSCYADTKDLIAKNVGGFAGSVGDDTTVSHSYAVTEVLKGGDVAAGFTAENKGSVNTSYALVGSVRTEAESSGSSKFGFAPSGTVTSCFFYAKELDTTGNGVGTEESTILSLNEDMKAAAQGEWLYDVDEDGETTTNAYSYPYTAHSSSADAPYNYMYQEDSPYTKLAYPAPRIKGDTEKELPDLDHYGDWPLPGGTEGLDCAFDNGDTLTLTVSLLPEDAEDDEELPETITVSFIGADSKKAVVFRLDFDETAGWTITKEAAATNPGSKDSLSFGTTTRTLPFALVDDTLVFTLDDITVENGHFAELFPELIPGENIRAAAISGVPAKWEELSASATANSLFADGSDSTAHITHIRHLQNLDPAVSGVTDIIKEAALDKDLTWDGTKYAAIYKADSSKSVSGSFYGIYNRNLTSFNGQNQRLTDFPFKSAPDTFSETGKNNAGLFRYADSALTVKNLMLEGTTVNGANAGTVVAEIGSGAVKLDTVLVVPKDGVGSVTASGVGGGLVGKMNGTSLKITNSASSVTVSAANQAGGLLGYQAGGAVTIEKSYVGGHTDSMKYDTSAPEKYNIRSTGAAAGGLIGEAAGGTLTVTESFGAASVSAPSIAGGLIGKVGINATVNKAYAVAPVSNVQTNMETAERSGVVYGNTTSGVLIGSIAEGKKVTNTATYYLPEVYPGTTQEDGGSSVAYVGGGAGHGTLTNPVLLAYYMDGTNQISAMLVDDSGFEPTMQSKTFPYDPKLKSDKGYNREYPFSIWTSFRFDSASSWLTYYGDWQPILNPPTVLNTITFAYHDPRTGSEVSLAEANLGTQKLIAGKGNHVLLPYVAEQVGYTLSGWELYDAETGDKLTTLTEKDGFITIAAEYCDRDLNAVAVYESAEKEYALRFWYDPSGKNTNFAQIGAAIKVEEGQTYSDFAGYVPARNIADYRLLGWYSDSAFTTPLDFASDAEITGDVNAYAKYEKIEYYTVTIDFMYQIDDGAAEILTNVPRYSIEDANAAQYKIQQVKGTTFEDTVTLPSITGYDDSTNTLEKTVERYYPTELGTGEVVDFELKNDGSDLYVKANTDSHIVVIYKVKSAEDDDSMYKYRVVYTLGHTKAGSTAADPDTTYDSGTCKYYRTEGNILRGFLDNTNAPILPSFQFERLEGFNLKTTEVTLTAVDKNGKGPDGKAYNCDYIIQVEYERQSYVLSFNSRAGTPVTPKTMFFGQPLNQGKPNTDPTRKGYDFAEWKLHKKGTAPTSEEPLTYAAADSFTWDSTMPAHHVEAVAVWEKAMAPYRVVIWCENADDAEYSYHISIPYTAKTGDIVRAEDIGNSLWQFSTTHKHTKDCYDGVGEAFRISSYAVTMSGITYTATITTSANGKKTVTVNKKSYDLTTASDGTMSFKVGSGRNSTTYYLTAVYQYNGQTVTPSTSSPTAGTVYSYTGAGGGKCVYLDRTWYAYTGNVGENQTLVCGKSVDAEHFQYDSEESKNRSTNRDGTETVKSDGSTVLNVYYSRNEYTFTFYEDVTKDQWENITGLKGDPIYDFSAKYQQDISNKWQFTGKNNVNYPQGSPTTSWKDYYKTQYNERLVSLFYMPAANVSFYHLTYTERTNKTYHYYVESIGSGDYTYNGKKYDLKADVLNDYNYLTQNEDFCDLNGFTKDKIIKGNTDITNENQPSLSEGDQVYFFYTRNSYTLDFFVDNEKNKSESVLYEKPLSSYSSYTPAKPAEYGEGYTFDGWYTSPACDEASRLDPDMTMPYTNLALYGRWIPPTYEVSFYLSESDTTAWKTLGILAGESAGSQITNASGELLDAYTPSPAPEGKEFDCWCYRDSSFVEQEFLYEQPITGGMKIYPRWKDIAEDSESQTADIHAFYEFEAKEEDGGGVYRWDAAQNAYRHYRSDGTVAACPYDFPEPQTLTDKQVGITVLVTAPTVDGYYSTKVVSYQLVFEDESKNEVTFTYKIVEPWQYTVEYYAYFGSCDDTVSLSGYTWSDPAAYRIDTEERNAYNRYETVPFTLPDDYADYVFDHFIYDGTKGEDITATIHPDSEGTAVVKFYLRPDPTKIALTDKFVLYDASNQANLTSVADTDNDIMYPAASIGTFTITDAYEYFNAAGEPITEAVNAGAYKMNGYVVLTITGTAESESTESTKSYLLWVEDEMGLNLRIGKRSVVLTSATLEGLYDPDAPSLKANDPTKDIIVSGDGFVAGEGADYVFSVEAFRKDVGISENSFTYSLKEGTLEDNYNIKVEYGTLSVYWEYDLTIYADFYGIPVDDAVAERLELSDPAAFPVARLDGIRVYSQTETLDWSPEEKRTVSDDTIVDQVPIIPTGYENYINISGLLNVPQPEPGETGEAVLHIRPPVLTMPDIPVSGTDKPESEDIDLNGWDITPPPGVMMTAERVYDYYRSGEPVKSEDMTPGDYTRDVFTVLEVTYGTEKRRFLLEAQTDAPYELTTAEP